MRSGLRPSLSSARTGITLNSAPVRATAFMKLTRLTSMKPVRPVRMRTCEPNGGNRYSGSELSTLRPGFVSGMNVHATAAARTPVIA